MSPRGPYQCASAAELPFSDGSFDLVLQSTVFTSILAPDLKRRVAAEMIRVVKARWVYLWYDYHVNKTPMSGCQTPRNKLFVSELSNRAPTNHVNTSFGPFVAPYSYLACFLLERFPPLCTHYLGVIRKELNSPVARGGRNEPRFHSAKCSSRRVLN